MAFSTYISLAMECASISGIQHVYTRMHLTFDTHGIPFMLLIHDGERCRIFDDLEVLRVADSKPNLNLLLTRLSTIRW